MRLSLRLLSFILLQSSLAFSANLRPHKKTYDTHQYYALELGTTSLAYAQSIASSLGVELVERIGELEDHWLIRREGVTPHHASLSKRTADLDTRDEIMERWDRLKALQPRGQQKKHLKTLTPLTLRQRSKRLSPRHHDFLDPREVHPRSYLPTRQDLTELDFAQGDIGIVDPMLNQQWHLINTELTDIELNVTDLWSKGIIGKGVRAVVVDDGLDADSDDLRDNFVSSSYLITESDVADKIMITQYAEGSYDFNDHTELPLPRLSDDQHGTRCAGEISAVKNDVCGVGVAYGAQIAGVRILSGAISDADEAAALNYHYQENDIYSCSWGPPDDGKSMEAPDGIILKAMVNGVQKGRGGKGSIFVFAAGNGGGVEDQCNFDGYTNSIFSITVGAVDRKGLHPYYSELCAAMMVVAPSSGSGDHIVGAISRTKREWS